MAFKQKKEKNMEEQLLKAIENYEQRQYYMVKVKEHIINRIYGDFLFIIVKPDGTTGWVVEVAAPDGLYPFKEYIYNINIDIEGSRIKYKSGGVKEFDYDCCSIYKLKSLEILRIHLENYLIYVNNKWNGEELSFYFQGIENFKDEINGGYYSDDGEYYLPNCNNDYYDHFKTDYINEKSLDYLTGKRKKR